MKKLMLLVSLFVLIVAGTSIAAPAAPQMSYSLNGTNISIDWNIVPDATGYTLYYAAYPYVSGDSIGVVDYGNHTTLSASLWDGAAYYLAVSSGNAQGNSDLSNIEYFIMKDHELAWETRESMRNARTQFAGGVINDNIYSFGGYDENGLLLNSLEIYNPNTDTWTAGTSVSMTRAWAPTS